MPRNWSRWMAKVSRGARSRRVLQDHAHEAFLVGRHGGLRVWTLRERDAYDRTIAVERPALAHLQHAHVLAVGDFLRHGIHHVPRDGVHLVSEDRGPAHG